MVYAVYHETWTKQRTVGVEICFLDETTSRETDFGIQTLT